MYKYKNIPEIWKSSPGMGIAFQYTEGANFFHFTKVSILITLIRCQF